MVKIAPSASSLDLKQLEFGLRAENDAAARAGGKVSNDTSGFFDMLKKGIEEVNTQMKTSEKSATDLATGKSSNIHETMLSVAKAELGFNMLVQLRNKAIEAYQEVMRMQV